MAVRIVPGLQDGNCEAGDTELAICPHNGCLFSDIAVLLLTATQAATVGRVQLGAETVKRLRWLG